MGLTSTLYIRKVEGSRIINRAEDNAMDIYQMSHHMQCTFCVILFNLQMTRRDECSILLFTEVGFELRVVCTQIILFLQDTCHLCRDR